jgi:hypothetical protein
MKKVLFILLLLSVNLFPQKLTTSAPTRLDLSHYYTDDLHIEIAVLDDSGDGFDFTGYTGTFNLKRDESTSAALKSFSVSFTDSIIVIDIDADSLTFLRAPRLLYYSLLLTYSGAPKTWLAGKFDYSVRPGDSQISSLTLAYSTTDLSLTIYGVSTFKDILSDSLNWVRDTTQAAFDSLEQRTIAHDTLKTDVTQNAADIAALEQDKIAFDNMGLSIDTILTEFPPGNFTYVYKSVYGKDTESPSIGRIDTIYNERHYKNKNYFNNGVDFNYAVDFRINAPGYNGGTGGNYYAGNASSVVIMGSSDTITSTNGNGQIYINGNHNKVSGNAWGVWLNGQYLHAQYKGLWVPAGSDNSFQKKPIPFSDQAIFWNEPIGMVTSDAIAQTAYPQRNSIFQQVLRGTDSTKFEWAIYQPAGTYNNYGLFAWQHFVPWESGGSGGIAGQRYRNLFSIDNASGNLDIIFNKSQWQGVTGWSAYGDVIVDNGNFVVDNYIDAPRLDSLETYYSPQWSGTATGLNASTARTSLGATTIGSNLFTLTNPSAISFLRINADNTVTARSAANFKTDLSLNNVENTALSTWAGSSNITTLGTVTSGTWNAGSVTSSGNINGAGTLQIGGGTYPADNYLRAAIGTFNNKIKMIADESATNAMSQAIRFTGYGVSKYVGVVFNNNAIATNSSFTSRLYIGSGALGDIRFGFWSNDPLSNTTTTFTDIMTINNNGNVGIGTIDLDGTPAVGRVTIKASANDGTSNGLVIRNSSEENKFRVSDRGSVYLSGGMYYNTRRETNGYFAENYDHIISIDATPGDADEYLPAGVTGLTYTFFKEDASVNPVTIYPDGSETINGAASFALPNQYDTVTITFNGVIWMVTSKILN